MAIGTFLPKDDPARLYGMSKGELVDLKEEIKKEDKKAIARFQQFVGELLREGNPLGIAEMKSWCCVIGSIAHHSVKRGYMDLEKGTRLITLFRNKAVFIENPPQSHFDDSPFKGAAEGNTGKHVEELPTPGFEHVISKVRETVSIEGSDGESVRFSKKLLFFTFPYFRELFSKGEIKKEEGIYKIKDERWTSDTLEAARQFCYAPHLLSRLPDNGGLEEWHRLLKFAEVAGSKNLIEKCRGNCVKAIEREIRDPELTEIVEHIQEMPDRDDARVFACNVVSACLNNKEIPHRKGEDHIALQGEYLWLLQRSSKLAELIRETVLEVYLSGGEELPKESYSLGFRDNEEVNIPRVRVEGENVAARAAPLLNDFPNLTSFSWGFSQSDEHEPFLDSVLKPEQSKDLSIHLYPIVESNSGYSIYFKSKIEEFLPFLRSMPENSMSCNDTITLNWTIEVKNSSSSFFLFHSDSRDVEKELKRVLNMPCTVKSSTCKKTGNLKLRISCGSLSPQNSLICCTDVLDSSSSSSDEKGKSSSGSQGQGGSFPNPLSFIKGSPKGKERDKG